MAHFVDILRFGGSAQSHLIYHPSSFFPRSALVNITVDVLGASINVLEAAARFEGFETLIEQFFGEDGVFPDERIMNMFNLKPHEERDKEEKIIQGYLRLGRSINEDINRVESHLNKLHRTVSGGVIKRFSVDSPKTKTKTIIPTNYNRCVHSNIAISTQSKFTSSAPSARSSCDLVSLFF